MRHLLLLPALAAIASAQEKVTYEDHVLPVFQQACLNCHNPDKSKGGLDLSSFAATMKGGSGGKIVEPGDVASRLISLVEHRAEPKMPPEGDRLPADQVEVLKQWIAGGLLETKASLARKPEKPKFETALRSDPAAKPEGAPFLPSELLLEPPVVTAKASTVHAMAVSPWAPLLAVTAQRQVLLHDTRDLSLLGILPFPEGDPLSLAFTPDGRYLLVGGGVAGKSGVTVTFDVTNGKRLLAAAREFDAVLAADIAPDFSTVATGGPSKLLKLWNPETGQADHSIKKHTDWLTALDISPDGVLLASGDRNGGVWVWETGSAQEFHTLRGHQAAITATAFRADSNLLASASEDGTVRFWEMNNGGEVKKIDAHGGGVTAFSFGQDGTWLTAGRDRKLKLWKADFSPDRELAKDLPHLPTSVALDATGHRAFIGDAAGIIRAFDTAGGGFIGELPANPPSIGQRLAAIDHRLSAGPEVLAQLEQAWKRLAEAEAAALSSLEEAKRQHRADTAARDQSRQEKEAAQAALETLRHDLQEKRRQADAPDLPEDQRISLRQAVEALAREENLLTLRHDAALKAETAAEERAKNTAQARQALLEAKQSTEQALAKFKAEQSALPQLHSENRRWVAASIRTRLIENRSQVEDLAAEVDERRHLCQQHIDRIAGLQASIEDLHRRRSEFHARHRDAAVPPETRREIVCVLQSLDARLAAQRQALAQITPGLAPLSDALDAALIRQEYSRHDQRELQAAYESFRQQASR